MVYESTVGKSDLVIGQEYFGSIVRKVKQEVEEKGGKYKIKRFVYLKNRVILVEEYTRTTSEGKVESKEYGGAPGQDDEEPKDDSALRAKAKALMAQKADKKKKKKSKSTSKKKKRPEPNLEEIYDVPAKVYPCSKLPDELEKGDPVSGAWKHTDDTDDCDWEPMDVVITKDPPTFLDIGEPNGIVALRIGALPDEEGRVDPFDLKFFAPGVEEPSFGFNKIGYWTPGKVNQQWPPVKPEPEVKQQKVVKPKLPDLDGEFAKVVPESKLSETQDADAPLTGVWKHGDGTDDTDWEPMFVDISTDPPSDLNPGEPHGVVAVEDGVEADENGNLDPSKLKFFTPGQEAPSNFNKLGHWRPGKLNQAWPPTKPKPPKPKREKPLELTLPDFNNVDAIILPKSKLPRAESDRPKNDSVPLTGVWKHKDDTDDFDWDPLAVVITQKPPLFLEPGEPHGLVAVEKGVKPNKVGRLDPSDLSFFTPGEKPPKNYKKVGHWRPDKLKHEWPPGKPILPDFEGPATVVPNSKAPFKLGKDDPVMGVWKHNDDTDDTDWDSLDVDITKAFPSDLEPGEPHGLVAVEEGVKPDKNGRLKPSNLKFFTPGEKPSPEYNKVGHWRPGKLNQEWPPVKRELPDFEGPATVTPKSKAPRCQIDAPQIDAPPLYGVWEHTDDTDDTDWDPMDVIITKEPVAFLEPDEPNGLVGWLPLKMDNELYNPTDIHFFKPGEEPPPAYSKVGKVAHWRPGILTQKWPPVTPTLPDFEGPARIWPECRSPYKQVEGAPLTGVWKHLDDEDDSYWDFLDVVITKEEPHSSLLPGEIHGIVAIDKDVMPNLDGTLDPTDICFFLPDEEPPPAFNKVGHWRPGRVLEEFPPIGTYDDESSEIVQDVEKPSLPSFDGDYAKVYPKSKVHEKSIKDPKVTGVWEHNDDTDDTDWDPIGVIITNDPPSEGDFHGIVAAEEDAKPNKVGKLDPSQLKFFTPGEEPPANYTKLGHWTPATKSEWPPSKPFSGRSLRNVGKLNLPDFDGVPESGVIYPRSQAPESHDAKQIIAKGIWKWSKPEHKPKDAESWIPSKVDMYENGNEPHDWDETQSSGVWGVNPDVDTNAKTKPTDLWFYPPNEEPDEGFEPIGKWRPKKAEWSYPPKSIGKVKDTRTFKEFERSPNSVGKLRVPSFFKGK